MVGASTDRSKWGNRAVRALLQTGDEVVPIHPTAATVEGLRAFRSVLDVPGPIDMATVYVGPRVSMGLLEEFVRKGVGEVWFNPGADADAVVEQARRLGLNVIVACSIIGAGQNPRDFA